MSLRLQQFSLQELFIWFLELIFFLYTFDLALTNLSLMKCMVYDDHMFDVL